MTAGTRQGAAAEPTSLAVLGPGDFALLVVGSIIGDGIYVVAGLGAQHLGPAQLVAWALAGVLAAIIGLAFIQCAAVRPEVGGSFAYASSAFGPDVGYMVGWALYLGEMVVLPVFPLAFARYLDYFVPVASGPAGVATKSALVVFVVGVNITGVRRSGRLNDVLTIAKLIPLAVIIIAAGLFAAIHPGSAGAHFTPFSPLGWGGFGTAVVLIFWAYAGFELSVLPAAEVQNPRKTLPRGLLIGITIATIVYLGVAVSTVVALPAPMVAASPRPLAVTLSALSSGLGLSSRWAGGFLSAGALISIVGVCDVYMLSVARLSYALAKEGSFPRPFALLHSRYRTPWFGLVFQGTIAIIASLLLDISGVLEAGVFFLGLCYACTGLAALRLVRREPGRAVHLPGLRFWLFLSFPAGVYLSLQASRAIMVGGVAVLAIGYAAYRISRRWVHAAPPAADAPG